MTDYQKRLIEVGPTALAWPTTSPWPSAPRELQSWPTYTMQKFKVNGQSFLKIEWKRTDRCDCITCSINSVGKKRTKPVSDFVWFASVVWVLIDALTLRLVKRSCNLSHQNSWMNIIKWATLLSQVHLTVRMACRPLFFRITNTNNHSHCSMIDYELLHWLVETQSRGFTITECRNDRKNWSYGSILQVHSWKRERWTQFFGLRYI